MANAASISRVLRSGGLRPIAASAPATREGIRVTGQFVRISVDSDRLANELAEDVERILAGAGYGVERVSERVIRWSERPSIDALRAAAASDLQDAHVEALHVAAVKIQNAREDRDEAIRQAFGDGVPVRVIAAQVDLTPARVYQLVAKADA